MTASNPRSRRAFLAGAAALTTGMLGKSSFAQNVRQRGKSVPMKITDVRVLPVGSYLFVQIHTNEGITGLGESGTWGFFTMQQFATLLERGAVQYIRPDVRMAGGLTQSKKIAALAEAHLAQVVPHNPLSPVSTAACVQLAACIPNFALLEYPHGEHDPPKSEIVRGALILEKGFLIVPDAPGIGVELAEGAAERHPYRPRELKTRLHLDGSIVDQ
ncbi:MAG: enolase C-terminal domain-like protein [Thermoguttaceae bacterium]|jgi:L-alanine-DL-glutamate epimerase-like enolase superfamily enzyme